jgi:hypothetical protein
MAALEVNALPSYDKNTAEIRSFRSTLSKLFK